MKQLSDKEYEKYQQYQTDKLHACVFSRKNRRCAVFIVRTSSALFLLYL